MLNPITNNKKYLLNYVIIWFVIIGVHFAVLHWYYQIPFYICAFDSILFNTFFAFLGISLWYVVRYNKPKSNFVYLLLNHGVSALIIVGFWLISGYLILRYAINNVHYLSFLDSSFPWRIVSGIFYYSAFILVYYVVVYYQDIQEKVKQEANLKTLIKEAELKALKNQINPHFLFNSLNSVSSLTLNSPLKAQEMIIKLSEYLRYSLKNGEQNLVVLKTEIANIKLYLEIEKIRFGTRLNFNFKNIKQYADKKIPAMILQPLIENAIKHGVYESTTPININLTCQLLNQKLAITISNEFNPKSKIKTGEGVGLKNIQQRLFLTYKQTNLVSINKTANTFTVGIKFPQNG